MDIVKHLSISKRRDLRDNSKKVTDPKKVIEAKSVYQKCVFVFLINWNLKLQIKFWFSFQYWSWGRKHRNKWFSDFQSNWTLKFKFELCFSFFNLIWKTKNQIYLNKYLIKLVAISLTQSKWISMKESNSSNDQTSNFRK